MYGEMVIVWVIALLLFGFLHRMPWNQIFGKVLGPPQTYIYGVLGLGLCYSGLLIWWTLYGREVPPWLYLIAFWGTVASGGGAVWGCYILEDLLEGKAVTKDEQARAALSARRHEDEGQ